MALALASNLFDEELSAEAKALLAPEPVATPPEKNGYFLLVGMMAPENEDAYAWGRKHVRVLAEADQFNDFASAEYLKARDGAKAERAKLVCDPLFAGKNNCLDLARERRATLAAWLAENAVLLRRYRSLRGYEAIEEAFLPLRSEGLTRAYWGLVPAQRGMLAQIAALAADGKATEAVEELAQEIALHRRLLVGARTPATRTVALVQLMRDHMMLSALLKEHAAAFAPHLERIAGLARPLSAREADMALALRADLRATARLLSSPRALEHVPDESALEGPVMKYLYKPNTSVNLYARLGAAVLDYARAPARELAARESALAAAIGEATRLCCWPHNPSGRAVVRAMLLTHDRAVKRVHDLDGLIRLVALQARAMAARAGEADLPKLLAQGAQPLADPYTGRPMRWDAAKRQIHFTPMAVSPWYETRFGRDLGRLAVTLP